MKNTLSEFKAFLNKGNVVDLAVAVIIGGAFGKIVSSLTDDVITPLLLKPAMDAANVDKLAELSLGSVKYGSFLSTIINFVIVAFVMFWIVKIMAKAMKKEAAAPAPVEDSKSEKLLSEIRDLLKK